METFGYDRILIPTDMSPFAKLALRYGLLFQERLGSALTLLYADEFYFPIDLLEVPMGYYLENAPETKQRLQEKLRDYATASLPLGAETIIAQEAPARAIVSTAENMRADLIIMGTHGRRGWRRAILGSVTEAVLHDSKTPVLTVTPGIMDADGPQPAIRKILCPVNFTRVARESLQHAGALAHAFGAELVVMYVAENVDRTDFDKVEAAFSHWVDPQIQARCQYTTMVLRHDDPAERVLEAATEVDADLMVIGAQHKWFSEATVIGTTTERITRFARCPVLTVVRHAVVEQPAEQRELIEV